MQDDLDKVVPIGTTRRLQASQRVRQGFSRGDLLTATIEYPSDVASYTEEGTRAHPISGNPLLRFYWPKLGRVVYFRRVNWRPGPGVRANKGWFSKAVRPAAWRRALRSATRTV